MASSELSVRRTDLPGGQSPTARAVAARTHQTSIVGALGHHPGVELHLRAFKPQHHQTRSQHDLHHGPGHGGPGPVAAGWLEGTYSETYPDVGQDLEGMKQLFKQFSFPGGIPSHVAPETPGS